MQKIVADRLRAESERDARGVADAQAALQQAYALLERQLDGRAWLASDSFSMADCAALPGLFYASILAPLPDDHVGLRSYFERTLQKASVQRVLHEAQPFLAKFPFADAVPARFMA